MVSASSSAPSPWGARRWRTASRRKAFLTRVPQLFDLAFDRPVETLASWSDWLDLFRPGSGVFDRPVSLLIDEFDDLPRAVIDRLVRLFRESYLARKSYLLHGLALVGVRGVLGVDSDNPIGALG
jgi:hypothetical protein